MRTFSNPTSLLRHLASLASGALLVGSFVILTAGSLVAAEALPKPQAPFGGRIERSAADSIPEWPQPVTAPKGAPHILLILLDDVGFADTSTFGGVAQTPALTALAADGLRYNRFHTAGLCAPTRAALLSGRNHHRMGFGTVGEAGYPGYHSVWKKSTASVAQVLRLNGYSTAAFGKWHNTPFREITPIGPFDRWPTHLGFEYYYGNVLGASSQWQPELWRDTVPVQPRKSAAEGYHYTTDIVNDAIRWLNAQRSVAPDKPYFMYFATGAAHAPHHVPKAWIEQYQGKFDQGWEKLRTEIFARQKTLGVIPATARLTPLPKELPRWRELSDAERRLAARQMEIYAAFIAHTDHEIGRLIQSVRRAPGGDNTLILYIVGDNGASAEALDVPMADLLSRLEHLEELGGPKFFNGYAAGWAIAGNTPFQWAKGIASHLGGTRNPLVVSWPARIKDKGGLRTQYTHVNDVAATLYEVAGISSPDSVEGIKQIPLDGVSFLDSFNDERAPSRHRQQYYEIWGNRAIYKDGWIAVARHKLPWERKSAVQFDAWESYDDDHWELYDLSRDFTQSKDLAKANPIKLSELRALFDQEARQNNVYPLISGNMGSQMPPVDPNDQLTFSAGTGMPVPNGVQFTRPQLPGVMRDFRITADVVIPEEGVEGVIVSAGGFFDGFALYAKENRLIYEHRADAQNVARIASHAVLPRGKAVLAFEFTRETAGDDVNGGRSRLYVNGELVAEGQVTATPPTWGYFSVGESFGRPISDQFEPPFRFSGVLEQVTVELK